MMSGIRLTGVTPSCPVVGDHDGEPVFVGDKGGAVMNLLRVRRLFADEQVARFGTFGPGGRPQQMPVRYALIDDGDDGVIVCTVDTWPQSIYGVARLKEITACPRVSFLADNGSAPGSGWWAQADAVGEVLRRSTNDPRFANGMTALVDKYHDDSAIAGARSLVWATVTRWDGWMAEGQNAA